MAWTSLCTYLRGRPENGTPDNFIRMLPRQNAVHSFSLSENYLLQVFRPLLLKSNYSRIGFSGLFGKCEIISLCISGPGFLPDTVGKDNNSFVILQVFRTFFVFLHLRQRYHAIFLFKFSICNQLI